MSNTRDGNATIGLNKGDGVNWATIPSLTGSGGVVTGPPGTGPNNFPQNATFTFTPNGNGYIVTNGGPAATVPEPGTLSLAATVGVLALVGYTLRRRKTVAACREPN